MRWTPAEKSYPKYGDRRTVTRFLWLPRKMGDEWRWLEKSSWTQEYQIFVYEDYDMGKWVALENEGWINK